MKKIVFTDLDGTLLDLKSYSYARSREAVEFLQNREIPLVFCSSKAPSAKCTSLRILANSF